MNTPANISEVTPAAIKTQTDMQLAKIKDALLCSTESKRELLLHHGQRQSDPRESRGVEPFDP
jgi:hypothetical protein